VTYYILVRGEVVPCESTLEWGKWLEENNRIICRNEINGKLISTVFLGIDHRFSHNGKDNRPVVFETMVWNGDDRNECYMDRYCTWDEAVAGHNKVLMKVINNEGLEYE
jgi:hypothetical protein